MVEKEICNNKNSTIQYLFHLRITVSFLMPSSAASEINPVCLCSTEPTMNPSWTMIYSLEIFNTWWLTFHTCWQGNKWEGKKNLWSSGASWRIVQKGESSSCDFKRTRLIDFHGSGISELNRNKQRQHQLHEYHALTSDVQTKQTPPMNSELNYDYRFKLFEILWEMFFLYK